MPFVTLDFETYYGDGLGFKTQTNEEYINDPRFEVIGVSVKINDEPAQWFSGTDDEIRDHLRNIVDWEESALLCHNMLFDGAILSWRYGIVPAFYYDTLCMARALHGVNVSNSLASLAKMYNLGVKGEEVVNAYGKRRMDFDPDALARYGAYCNNDTELTFLLFQHLAARLPNLTEHKLIDMTLRMYTMPVLHVDDALLTEKLKEIREDNYNKLTKLKERLGVDTEEAVRKILSSNPQFAQLLIELGVDPPTKISAKTGKETWAFAKNDEGFLELLEHPDPFIQQLCALRMGTKSTIEESRIERFIDIGARNKGLLPIPLRYYGAHTGRWSGQDGVNLQNLPSRDKAKKTLKNSIRAPHDFYVLNCDSSQIEARTLAWLAEQDDVVEAFAQRRDIYCEDASKVYGRTITKADPVERFVGKTMRLGLGYGTGKKKLRHTLKTTPPGADVTEEECERWVNIWRSENARIVALWREGDQVLQDLMAWPSGKPAYWFGKSDVVLVTQYGLMLPNSLLITYKNLRMEDGKMVHDARDGTKSIWGGVVVENCIQALARIVIGEQMCALPAWLRPVLTVHDAAVVLVPKPLIDEAVATITNVMSTPPRWGQSLPVACEAKYGESYGDC